VYFVFLKNSGKIKTVMSTKIFNPSVSYIELGILIIGLTFAGVVIFICRPILTLRIIREMFRVIEMLYIFIVVVVT
jgi:hypothetical protein